jgi:hypothetical protein
MKIDIRKHAESGSTIVVAVLTTVILGSFVALAVEYTSNVSRNAQRDRVFNTAVEIGDGCLEQAYAAWRQDCKTAGTQNPSTSAFSSIPTPTGASFPSYSGVTIANYRVQAVDPFVTLASDNPPMSALATTDAPPMATGPGTGTFSYFYLSSVDVTLPYVGGTLTAKVRRILEKRFTSAWNWAMMYDGDLEFHPDAPLALDGWVHTNNSIYAGNGSYNPLVTPTSNLTFADRLTYAGNYTLGFSPNDLSHSGQVNVVDATTPANLPPGHEQVYSPFGWDTAQFNTSDSNPNNDGFHEMIDRSTNTATYPDPFAGQRLWDQAGIAVTVDANNTVTVYFGTGATKTDVTAQNGNSDTGTAATAALASVYAGGSIQDNREQASVRMVNFDVAKFLKSYPTDTTKNWNGIVYITDTSASSSNHRAIRVINGSKLPTGGMTIVSNNPVYIQGDFNSGRTTSSEPPSNTGTPTDPDVSGYTHQPASIMADAITLLSNNWQDKNAGAGLSSRIASNTTVNAALVAGNVPSNGSNYSGGGENFVRFLEDWTGKSFTYYGSMLNLYSSAQGTGLWGNGNVYAAPQQKWYFDSTLSVDSSGNPVTVPGYISTVAYLQQQRWYLQY